MNKKTKYTFAVEIVEEFPGFNQFVKISINGKVRFMKSGYMILKNNHKDGVDIDKLCKDIAAYIMLLESGDARKNSLKGANNKFNFFRIIGCFNFLKLFKK